MSVPFPQRFWGMLALALALVVGSAFVAGGLRDVKGGNDEIQVTGSARRPIRSDFVVWRLSVTSQRPALRDAYQEVSGDAAKIRAFLASSGVADSLLTVRPVETETVYRTLETGMQTGEVLGYRLTQRFEVRSRDVDGTNALAQRATQLIGEGVPLVSMPPEYLFTRLNEVRTEMLAEATRDARQRAESIAGSAGSRIGAVRSARMGVFQITPRNSTEVSDYGINDTSSLDKDITAVVRVTFAVK